MLAIEVMKKGESISWVLIACAYSPLAILTNLLISLIIPASVLALGRLRLPGFMPMA